MSGRPSPPREVPVEEPAKKIRRFAPEPVETTTRSNKKGHQNSNNNDNNGQDLSQDTTEKRDFAGKKRFSPTPIETTFKSSKKPGQIDLPTPDPTPRSIHRSSPTEETPKPRRRRFSPELIETTRRSKRANVAGPATLPTDKTDITPGVPNIYTLRPKRTPGAGSSTHGPSSSNSSHERISPRNPRKQGSMKPHLNTRRGTRQNSFQPELGAIESHSSQENSDQDDSSLPSLSNSIESQEESLMKLQLARTRESCDDRFSGYLLALAAKAAEKQLREQALAAFPNESFHEIVEHFYDREREGQSDEESVEGTGMLLDDPIRPEVIRRKSTEVGWAFKEMQQHQEKLSRQREEETNKKIAAEASDPTFKDPFWTNGQTEKPSPFQVPAIGVNKQKEAELRSMRSAASPPMLGTDLKFRMCPSPKATKFESDQRHDVQPNRSDTGGGLWGGYCVTEEADQYLSPALKGPTMIQTPNVEKEDPFSFQFGTDLPKGAKSPTGTKSPKNKDSGVRMLSGLDERLKLEIEKSKVDELLLRDFNDTFITQVYNYLSLGYPALARQYDLELAKISQISEAELRADDSKRNAKGYIGITDPTNGQKSDKDDKHSEYCVRWKALRLYILEWARQHPSMASEIPPPAWGVRARRGSWAI